MPTTIISPWAQWHPQTHGSSWRLPLCAESSRQLALLQHRHINPDSLYMVTYSCSGGAHSGWCILALGSFSSYQNKHSCACERHNITSLPEAFCMLLLCPKKLQTQTFPKVPISKYVGRWNLKRHNIWQKQLLAGKAKTLEVIKKKKSTFKKFQFVLLTCSNEQWQKECDCWEHSVLSSTRCWGKVGRNSRNCFQCSLDLWRHLPAPPRSCEISTHLLCCNNKIALKSNNEDNTL